MIRNVGELESIATRVFQQYAVAALADESSLSSSDARIVSSESFEFAFFVLFGRKPPYCPTDSGRITPRQPLSCETFLQYVRSYFTDVSSDPDDMVYEALDAFDVDSKGYVTRDDIERVMKSIASLTPDEQNIFGSAFYAEDVQVASRAFDIIDDDGDGRLTAQDFKKVLCS